jgi:hypothetical protein
LIDKHLESLRLVALFLHSAPFLGLSLLFQTKGNLLSQIVVTLGSLYRSEDPSSMPLYCLTIHIVYLFVSQLPNHPAIATAYSQEIYTTQYLNHLEKAIKLFFLDRKRLAEVHNLCFPLQRQSEPIDHNSETLLHELQFILGETFHLFDLSIQKFGNLEQFAALTFLKSFFDGLVAYEPASLEVKLALSCDRLTQRPAGYNFQVWQKPESGLPFTDGNFVEFQTRFDVSLNEIMEQICESCGVLRKFNVLALDPTGEAVEIRTKNDLHNLLKFAIERTQIDMNCVLVRLMVETDIFG